MTTNTKEMILQEAIHIVLEHKAVQLEEYRKKYEESGKTDENLEGLIMRTNIVLSELELESNWI